MRDQAGELVRTLSQYYTNKDVEFGLVPFSHAVRVTMPETSITARLTRTW